MDLNLKFWKSEGNTFLQRFLHWIDILDPLLLLKSRKEIERSRTLLITTEPDIANSLHNKKIKEAWKLSLGSVNPATGDILPFIFRLPAFLPFTAPLAVGILLPHRGAKQMFGWQLFFHTYTSGFSLAHGNLKQDSEEFPLKQILLSTGAILYSSSLATLPCYIMTRYQVQSPSMKFIPGPLTAILCAFNVLAVRASEFENGIEIMDSNGVIIGVSQKAGEKAVKETALSRAVMIGTAVCIPDIVLHFFKRTNSSIQYSRLWISLRSITIISILGLMMPVSFSWFPQLGTIQRSLIEPEIISSTEETEFFYNRGL